MHEWMTGILLSQNDKVTNYHKSLGNHVILFVWASRQDLRFG